MKSSRSIFLLLAVLFLTGTAMAQFPTDEEEEVELPEFFKLSTLEIVVSSGFGYRLEPVPDQTTQIQRSYLEGMKSTLIYSGEVIHYYKEKVGVGLNYSLFHTNDEAVDNWGFYINENMSTHFVGPMLVFRETAGDDKWFFGPKLGLGYMYYHNDAMIRDNDEYRFDNPVEEKFRGHSAGVLAGFYVMRKVSDHFGVGLGLNLIAGVVGTKNNYWQTGAQKEDLSRFEFSIKLHYVN